MGLAWNIRNADMLGMVRETVKPRHDIRIARKIKAALTCGMGIGVKRDISDA